MTYTYRQRGRVLYTRTISPQGFARTVWYTGRVSITRVEPFGADSVIWVPA